MKAITYAREYVEDLRTEVEAIPEEASNYADRLKVALTVTTGTLLNKFLKDFDEILVLRGINKTNSGSSFASLLEEFELKWRAVVKLVNPRVQDLFHGPILSSDGFKRFVDASIAKSILKKGGI
jgi:hypothetical protein